MKRKRCTKCKRRLVVNSFFKSYRQCKNCLKATSDKWKANNPDKVKHYARVSRERYADQRCEYNRRYRKIHKQQAAQAAAKWKLKNRKRYLEQRRWAGLKAKYGLTKTGFETLLKIQHGRCAICRKLWAQRNRKRSFEVDHCHRSQRIRGLLCENCNRAIGLMQENVRSFRNAVAYLLKHRGY